MVQAHQDGPTVKFGAGARVEHTHGMEVTRQVVAPIAAEQAKHGFRDRGRAGRFIAHRNPREGLRASFAHRLRRVSRDPIARLRAMPRERRPRRISENQAVVVQRRRAKARIQASGRDSVADTRRKPRKTAARLFAPLKKPGRCEVETARRKRISRFCGDSCTA